MNHTKTKGTPFLDDCQKIFHFLQNEYGFHVHIFDAKENKIVYENETTAVILSLDIREQTVSVFIGRKDRKITGKLTRWNYDLGDIIVPKNRLLENEYSNTDLNWSRVLKQRALHIKKYASEILKGNFSDFTLAQREVNKRDQEYWSRYDQSVKDAIPLNQLPSSAATSIRKARKVAKTVERKLRSK